MTVVDPVLDRGYGENTYGGELYGAEALPTDPTALVEVWTPAGWVDVTCDVQSIDIQLDRSSYLESFAAGSATVELRNTTGRYSGWSTFGIWAQASPYRIDVPIRIRMRDLDTVYHTLFTGTTDSVTDSWPDIVDDLATVTASDGFKLLARYRGLPQAAAGAGEKTGARIGRLADLAAWTGPRAIDIGTVALQATTLEGIALDQMRKVGEAEWGWLFIAGDGTLTFRQRDVIQTDPRMVNIQWTFTDIDDQPVGAICYSDVALSVDDDYVLNIAQVTPPGLPTQTARDNNSIAWFGPRTWTRDDLPIQLATDALGLAQLVVLEQSTQARHLNGITFPAATSREAYQCATGVRIGDRVRFIRRYPDGYVLDAELLVNGIHHKITADASGHPRDWTVDLTTFDALLVHDYGLWDGPAGAGVGGWDVDQWGV